LNGLKNGYYDLIWNIGCYDWNLDFDDFLVGIGYHGQNLDIRDFGQDQLLWPKLGHLWALNGPNRGILASSSFFFFNKMAMAAGGEAEIGATECGAVRLGAL
jgi:hypothetical protein